MMKTISLIGVKVEKVILPLRRVEANDETIYYLPDGYTLKYDEEKNKIIIVKVEQGISLSRNM